MALSAFEDELELAVVFSQYDRQTHGGALERLLALLEVFEGIRSTVLVVDNANPGTWYHEVSSRLIHLGGDNSNREFSAFRRGLEYIQHRALPVHVYAFVTDAYRAYGDDFLEFVDDKTVRYCFDLDCPVGWVDSFGQPMEALGYPYDHWIRTSLLFLPSSALGSLGNLETPLDREKLFSQDPSDPFATDAPLSQELQDQLLAWLTTESTPVEREEVWHSRFQLNTDTFSFFQAKVCAILQEQLLSARLAQLGRRAYDFRIIRRMAEKGLVNFNLSDEQRIAWSGLGFLDAEIRRFNHYSLDHVEVPQYVPHCQPGPLEVRGWAVTDPPVQEVEVHLGHHVFRAPLDIPRPDVTEALPGEGLDPYCGFKLLATLENVPSGDYPVAWVVPEAGLRQELGSVRITPAITFEPVKLDFQPEAWQGQVPMVLEARVLSSEPLEAIEVRCNGRLAKFDGEPLLREQLPNGLRCYELLLSGEAPFDADTPQHCLEVILQDESGHRETWQTQHIVETNWEIPHRLTHCEIGPRDSRRSIVPIHLAGSLRVPEGAREVHLLWQGKSLVHGELGDTEARGGFTLFDLRGQSSEPSVGNWSFELAVTGPELETTVFASWESQVHQLVPEVYVDLFAFEQLAKNRHLLKIAGWVKHHHLVGELALTLDGAPFDVLALDRLRPDVAQYMGEPLARHQGFAAALKLENCLGKHRFELLAGEEVLWGQDFELEEPRGDGFVIDCSTLRTLVEEGDPPTFWSSITLQGRIETDLEDVVGTLYVEGQEVDRRSILPGSLFELRYRPETSGEYDVRATFEAGGRSLHDSGTVRCRFEPVEIPGAVITAVDRFLDTYDVRSHLGLGDSREVTRALIERDLETLSHQLEMMHSIDHAFDTVPGVPELPPLEAPERDLKILFASWNVPCLRHGGGVWMTHLLEHLSKRHEITVVYCYSPEEEGWAEDIRPYAHRLIGIPRTYRRTPSHEYDPLFGHLYSEYVAELRATLELEVRSGRYDLVDYQYVRMLPHVARANIPSVLTIFEEGFTAGLSREMPVEATGPERIDRLDELLKTFYLDAVHLPKTFRHMITVTEEDARILRAYQSSAAVHTNGIGVDTGRLKPPEESRAQDEKPTVVFLGNYKHPPSVDAARFFADQVLPTLRQRFPELQYQIVGAFPTPELEALGEKPGIEVTGFVDDYRPYLWRASAFVAPIFTGSGMRVKVLEAMACGTPLVTTQLALHGIGGEDGEHYLRAEKAEQFAEATARLLDNPEFGRQIGEAGRQHVRKHHSNEARAREREAIWWRIYRDWHARNP